MTEERGINLEDEANRFESLYKSDMSAKRWIRRNFVDILNVALVVALAGSAQYEIWVHPLVDDGIPGPQLPNTFLLLAITVPLLWRRRAPVAAFALVLGAVGLQIELIDRHLSDQAPVQHWLAGLIAFYSIAANARMPQSALVAGLGGAVLIIGDLLWVRVGYGHPAEMIPAWFMLAAAWGIGYVVHGRSIEAVALYRKAEQLERAREEEARRAVAEERARIARELHDVVAHALTVMVVQAQAGQRAPNGDRTSASEFAAIENAGREALVEMRRLLGVLRHEGEQMELAPLPTLANLDSLVAQMERAGLSVSVTAKGSPHPLAPGIELSAYRIVQEALTNALRHGKAAHAEVTIRYRDAELEVEVTDDGEGSGAGTGGYGLAGMRERAQLVGGRLESGPGVNGGYCVKASLPL